MLHDGGDDLDDDGDDGPRWEVSCITLLQVGRSWSHLAPKSNVSWLQVGGLEAALATSWGVCNHLASKSMGFGSKFGGLKLRPTWLQVGQVGGSWIVQAPILKKFYASKDPKTSKTDDFDKFVNFFEVGNMKIWPH